MQIDPYLEFGGNCEKAFKFYETALGGKIEFMQNHRDSPMRDKTPPEWLDKIMHARLNVGGKILMGMDSPPDRYQGVKGCWISLGVKTPQEAERLFNALAQNGTVRMPLEKTFWSEKFGMVVDQFGIPWMVGCASE